MASGSGSAIATFVAATLALHPPSPAAAIASACVR